MITRTTTLTSVPHKSFALRFSDLVEIEEGCRESEEERAVRTIDWISSRINKRCAKWVEEMENVEETEVPKTPWWDELRRCAEGDHVPSRFEGWNHPVAGVWLIFARKRSCLDLNVCTVILAVSTMTVNPLQALTTLHARALDLPSWVDPAILKYTLIVHPRQSSLSDEEYVVQVDIACGVLVIAHIIYMSVLFSGQERFSMRSRSSTVSKVIFFPFPYRHHHRHLSPSLRCYLAFRHLPLQTLQN